MELQYILMPSQYVAEKSALSVQHVRSIKLGHSITHTITPVLTSPTAGHAGPAASRPMDPTLHTCLLQMYTVCGITHNYASAYFRYIQRVVMH